MSVTRLSDLTTPGEDYYNALRAESRATETDSVVGLLRALTSMAWGDLPPRTRAIFHAAALRFLSEE